MPADQPAATICKTEAGFELKEGEIKPTWQMLYRVLTGLQVLSFQQSPFSSAALWQRLAGQGNTRPGNERQRSRIRISGSKRSLFTMKPYKKS